MAYVTANTQLDPKNVTAEVREENLRQVREGLHKLESQTGSIWSTYQQTRAWCLDEFRSVYSWLGVHFDVDFYESQMEAPAQAIVDTYLEKGIFEISDGAAICDLKPDEDVPALVRKRDGTSLYMTWDLSLASRKFDEFGVDRSDYVVGSEQRFHFRQLFLTLKRMGYARAKDCRHIHYELVMLPDGVKMSSRNGTAIPLYTLQSAVREMIEQRLNNVNARVPKDAWQETVRRLAIASLKYGMLRIGTNKKVIFSLEDWTQPEGNTGVYLLYNLARMRSVQQEANVKPNLAAGVDAGSGFGQTSEERALLNQLLQLPGVIARAEAERDPSILASWCYGCARAFSRFWTECPVLKAEPRLRGARLSLIALSESVLSAGLDLLGIEPVDAM